MRYITMKRINEWIDKTEEKLSRYYMFLKRYKNERISKKQLLEMFTETKNAELITDLIYQIDYMSDKGVKLDPCIPRKLQDIESYSFEILAMLKIRGID